MDDKNFTTGFFLITALQIGQGREPIKRVWYGIDSDSGGYPFWADSITHAAGTYAMLPLDKIAPMFNRLMDGDGDSVRMLHGIVKTSIKIVEIMCEFREDLNINKIERDTILSKLPPHERQILGFK